MINDIRNDLMHRSQCEQKDAMSVFFALKTVIMTLGILKAEDMDRTSSPPSSAAEERAPGGESRSEAKYVNALRIALRDKSISETERAKLDSIGMECGISLERMEAIDRQVLEELGAPEPEQVRASDVVASVEEDDWEGIVSEFLCQLKKKLESNGLPFVPTETASEEEIEDDHLAYWKISDRYYFGIWFESKRLSKISLFMGFCSERESRDPLFRQMCKAFDEVEGLLDEDGYVCIEDHVFDFDPDYGLAFHAKERIELSDLKEEEFLEATTRRAASMMTELWPVVADNLE